MTTVRKGKSEVFKTDLSFSLSIHKSIHVHSDGRRPFASIAYIRMKDNMAAETAVISSCPLRPIKDIKLLLTASLFIS